MILAVEVALGEEVGSGRLGRIAIRGVGEEFLRADDDDDGGGGGGTGRDEVERTGMNSSDQVVCGSWRSSSFEGAESLRCPG